MTPEEKTVRTRARRRGKADERAVAEYLGGERVPTPGRTRGWAPDVEHPWLAIEVKSRARLPVLLVDAMDQAEKSAEWSKRRGKGGKLPIVVIHQKGQHFRKALVVMRLGEFVDRFGS